MTMMLTWIGVAALVAAITVGLLKKTSARAVSAERPAIRRYASAPVASPAPRPAPASEQPAPEAPAVAPPEVGMPAALAGFVLNRADDLPDDRRRAYASTFRDIPRPPKLLHHLLSPDFVGAASSAQLVDLIIAEPLIAARVLTAVNSSLYGLKTQVGGIGQAVTYLGLNTVRSLCLNYILVASFKADSAERKQLLDAAWTASALASELTQQLSYRLGFEDRGALVSGVVLSFLGRLATTATVSRADLASIAPHGLLDRTISEQRVLGLCASQIGRLLMSDWGLPASIVADAAEIDSVMITPHTAFDADRGSRLALCYVCARLGERIAEGQLQDLAAFDPYAESDAELFHFRGYLNHPKLERLLQTVRSPEIGARLAQVLSAARS